MGAHAPIATYGSEGEPQETQVGTNRRRIRHVRWDSPRFPLPALDIRPWLLVPGGQIGHTAIGRWSRPAGSRLVQDRVRNLVAAVLRLKWARKCLRPWGVANLSLCPGSTTLI